MASDQEIKKAQKLADANSDINKLDDVLKKKLAIKNNYIYNNYI